MYHYKSRSFSNYNWSINQWIVSMPLKLMFSFLRGMLQSRKHSITYRAKKDDLEGYYRKSCVILLGIRKPKEETWENIKISVLEILQKTGFLKEEIERNIGKPHRVGWFDHEIQTQPILVKFKIHNVKEKFTTSEKSLQKELKSPH